MAHGDYKCCAVCDRKMDYVGMNDKFKTSICQECLVVLRDKGIMAITVKEFMKWVKGLDDKTALKQLKEIGYQDCYYSNEVDQTVAMKLGVSNNRALNELLTDEKKISKSDK